MRYEFLQVPICVIYNWITKYTHLGHTCNMGLPWCKHTRCPSWYKIHFLI